MCACASFISQALPGFVQVTKLSDNGNAAELTPHARTWQILLLKKPQLDLDLADLPPAAGQAHFRQPHVLIRLLRASMQLNPTSNCS